MAINEVSLAAITEGYLAYLNALEGFPMREIAEFVLIAATLLLIKSRSLMPALPVSEEEEMSIFDLEKRLRLYQAIKKLGPEIRTRFGPPQLFMKTPAPSVPVFSPSRSVTLASIGSIVDALVGNLPSARLIPQLAMKKIISLEEVVANLVERIGQTARLSLSSLVGRGERSLGVLHFLAILELVRRGNIYAMQSVQFHDIEITRAKST